MFSGLSQKQEVKVHIRWMIRRDMSEVTAIEERGSNYPWVEEDFLQCLRQRNCIGMVAESGDEVVGFMVYELQKNRLRILNFSVHPNFRRNRIGSQMAQKLVLKLSSHRRNCISVELRESNLESQLFFRSMGFRAVRVQRSFFQDSGEDAYLMQYRVQASQIAAA